MPEPGRTVIVGGGLAGLAAAAALASSGVPVTLLESRPRLGGRASSFVDRETGTLIDNCQHVTLGCCTNFRHFCDSTGVSKYFRQESELHFVGPDGRITRFASSPLPAPLHLAYTFWRLPYLTLRDKFGLARGVRSLALTRDYGKTEDFANWLARHAQSSNAIERFWQVVLVSALSESLDRISVSAARKVFVDSFLRNRHGWTMSVPTVPLEVLYGHCIVDWMRSRGVEIRLQSGVAQLADNSGLVDGVKLRDGDVVTGEDFVLAVPHSTAYELLPPSVRDLPAMQSLTRLETAPISSVHLWFDREITALPHAVLVGRMSQWLFNRSALAADSLDSLRDTEQSRSLGYAYQVVISASRDVTQLSSDVAIEKVIAELAGIWPAAATAKLLHARLVTEHKAVFSPLPESDSLRPSQQSPFANLQLAGDWTATGWPATMEGAVRSGYLAAENVLRRRGIEQQFVQPDLPTVWLSKLLFRL